MHQNLMVQVLLMASGALREHKTSCMNLEMMFLVQTSSFMNRAWLLVTVLISIQELSKCNMIESEDSPYSKERIAKWPANSNF